MRVVIIGSGNVANVIAKKLLQAGHQILEVVGRNRASVEELAAAIGAAAVPDLRTMTVEAEVYLVAIADDALEGLTHELPQLQGVLAHTAGSVSKEVLAGRSESYGVFYPLQTLKKGLVPQASIPILIDGNNEHAKSALGSLAATISDQVRFTGDEERARLHLAATVVNNFSHHLFAVAADYCKNEQVPFELLIPLIQNTIDQLGAADLFQLQTGPAKRGDIRTIDKHLLLLEGFPHFRDLYMILSKSISRSAGETA